MKSGYKTYWNSQIEQQRQENQEYNQLFSTLSQYKQVWKSIWEMKIQPKIKIFTWRAARNILPTRNRLLSKIFRYGIGVTFVGVTLKRLGT